MVQLASSYDTDRSADMIGSVSISNLHEKAPTHALIKVSDSYVAEVIYPPTLSWTPDQFREIGIAFYNREFLTLAEEAPGDLKFLSQVLIEALKCGKRFRAEQYFSQWYHFATPKDLAKS